MKLIYVVEDHQIIREGVIRYLEMAGFSAMGFGCLKHAAQALETKVPDLLIQDVMLPDGDGFDFVRDLRKNADIPVIFMTARIEEEDRIKGLEIGADDYISKPFSPKELVLRVQAVLRRVEGGQNRAAKKSPVRRFRAADGLMCINTDEHSLTINNVPVVLTAAEWRVLVYLAENCSRVVTRNEILEECFDYKSGSYGRIADTHIKNLRAKLGTFPWIDTVRGYGYRFIGFEETEK